MERSQQSRSEWMTVPNLLSLSRLLATPALCWLIAFGPRAGAVALFVAMGITDHLDGRIARATGSQTELGALLDPVADRVVIASAIVTLIVTGDLPWWLAAPVIVREAAVSATFLALGGRGLKRPKVKAVGKTATAALFVALPLLMLPSVLGTAGIVVFAFGAVLYYIAAFRYAQDVKAELDARGRTRA